MIAPIAPNAVARRLAHLAALLFAVVLLLWRREELAGLVPDRRHTAERDWPMFGGRPNRNMVNLLERDLPADWCVAEGKSKNIKWSAELGDRSLGSPVVVGGRVFVATNNAKLREAGGKGQKAVLRAFQESDGKLLWQIEHDVPKHWENSTGALMSTPTVVGGCLHYVTGAGEVVCADANSGKIRWRYDMVKQLGVHTYREACFMDVTPTWCSPLVIGDRVFVSTGNGVDEEGKLVAPQAPSFVAIDRRTGKLIWQSSLPGKNVINAGWSSPAYSDRGGRAQVIFGGADGVIYSFVPETGELLWKCDCLPQRKRPGETSSDNQFVGSPVIAGDRLYIGMGIPTGFVRKRSLWSWFLCLDITKKGDVSLKSYAANAAGNKDSALIWAYGGPIQPRPEKGLARRFGSTVSTAAVDHGLVYIPEQNGYLHCLDATTGRRLWVYDLEANVDGSPYLTDGRVFVATDAGDVHIFSHSRAASRLATIDMEDGVCTTPTAANGTLYVATRSKLFAIGSR